jgi:hypothetical protein
MRAGSPNQFFPADSLTDFRPSAKSLFRNILPVSPYGSRFCQDQFLSKLSNLFRINILEILTRKIWSDQSHAKSLFWKILAISPWGSRFCACCSPVPPNKLLRMNILGKWTRKKVGPHRVAGTRVNDPDLGPATSPQTSTSANSSPVDPGAWPCYRHMFAHRRPGRSCEPASFICFF